MATTRFLIPIVAALALVVALPAMAAAGPASEHYTFQYPDAKGAGGSGPEGSAADGTSGTTLAGDVGGTSGESSQSGGPGGQSGGDGDGRSTGGGVIRSTSGVGAVPTLAAQSADEGGIPTLLVILALTALGGVGFAIWRRRGAVD